MHSNRTAVDRLPRHDYAPDSTATDRPGLPVACVICSLPEANAVHQDVPDHDTARLLGEANL